ncbi:MAG: glycoside hydrolase family 127 protein [Promethearchaeota archaeon]
MVLRKQDAVSLEQVDITGGFWLMRQVTNREASIPSVYDQLKRTGRIDCFDPGYRGFRHKFYDSDTAKWIEAACYSLKKSYDAELEGNVERVINLMINCQEPDGYLNSFFRFVMPGNRWKNLRDDHELYCAGHLMEAAVAHYEFGMKKHFLDIISRYADYINSVFGRGEGQIRGYPGHEEIELALVRLFRATGNEAYRDLARFFVEERGNIDGGYYYVKEAMARGEEPRDFLATVERMKYWQAHAPVREQEGAVGHAVRACYLYAGVADVADEFSDESLLDACKLLWDDIYYKKMYITGGIGARYEGEAFGEAYELGNENAYAETCAAIAFAFFSQRMLQITGDGKYADAVERIIYNGALSGVSLDGRRFFYINPLAYFKNEDESIPRNWHSQNQRPEWFGCSCCPPNIARLLASIGTYFYSEPVKGTGAGTHTDHSISIHHYATSKVRLELGGVEVEVVQDTRYPWDGLIECTINPDAKIEFPIRLRIPSWCERTFSILVNGEKVEAPVQLNYVVLDRTWQKGDTIALDLNMYIRRIYSHPRVKENTGRVALQRGPIIYCLESTDNTGNGGKVDSLVIPRDAELTSTFEPGLLGGVVTISGSAYRLEESQADALYMETPPAMNPVRFKAVPYYAWANREPGEMIVWIREKF